MFFTTFVTIWLLHMGALITPGANTLLITHLAASGNVRNALFAAVGVAIGVTVWSTAAVLGVGAFFAAFPAIRLALQVAGAIYLLYVAYLLWRSGGSANIVESSSRSAFAAIKAGVLTNLSNPKAALFFGSVFSTALPKVPSINVLLISVSIVIFNALWWHLLLALIFSRPVIQQGYAKQQNLLSKFASILVGSLGLLLFIASLNDVR